MRHVVLALLLIEVAVFVGSTLPGVRSAPGFDTTLDGWVQGSAYVLTAAVAALGAVLRPRERLLWGTVAAALTLRAAAFVWFLADVRLRDPVPYPSLADAGWLGMSVVLLVALAMVARHHLRRLPPALVLDGLVGALTTAGIVIALLYDSLVTLTAAVPADVTATNLAYPALDVATLLMLIGVLVAYRWRPPRPLWLLSAGAAGFAITDCVFLYQAAAGTFRPGTLISALSMVATTAIATAAWIPRGRHVRRVSTLPGLVLPGLFALASLAVLVYASVEDVPLLGVILTTAALVAVIARTIVTFREVRAIAELRREARTDELTGAANRRAFNEHMAAALRDRNPERPLALLIVDLDDFKGINDALGHHHGDALLALLTSRLQVGLRPEDLLARIGGDEFAIVVDGADADAARSLAERLLGGLRRPFAITEQEVPVAASVGIALFPRDSRDPGELLQLADVAMYEAKSAHSGWSFFEPEQQARRGRRRVETVAQIRSAIEARQFVVHYQPQIHLLTGDVVGVEALVRWEHPHNGLLGPGDFLPQAEAGGLMGLLTRDVLDQALAQAAQWRAAGHDLSVSVNLSVTNLLDEAFPDEVLRMLRTHDLPGHWLVLELTEDLFMADPVRGRAVMAQLLDSGVRLSVDDYGTGYSSLGYIRDLPDIGGIKLDRSFVDRLGSDHRCEAIVSSTVALCRSLGLQLVAEGVETEVVAARLRALGCEVAQGYYFARPAPAAELELSPGATSLR